MELDFLLDPNLKRNVLFLNEKSTYYRETEGMWQICLSIGKECPEVGALFHWGDSEEICRDMISIFDMPCKSLPNYLSVTLTPSNSIFHTSRLYSLFKNWHEGITYSRNIMFHEEWNDEVSEIMIE